MMGGGGGGGGGVGVDSPSAFERSTIKLYKMTDLKPGPCFRRIVLCFRRISLYLSFFEICAQCQLFLLTVKSVLRSLQVPGRFQALPDQASPSQPHCYRSVLLCGGVAQ